MSFLAVGLSYRTAPVSLLERTALQDEAVGKLLTDLVAAEHVGAALVLSTCNRVEVYVDTDKFHAGLAETSDLLARHADVPLAELTPHLYVHYGDRAVAQLFTVACGLDSMVVGESQILGQVRQALRLAQQTGTAGGPLNELAQQALRVGKRARTDTGIDRAGRSVVSAGLDLAERSLGTLRDRSVLLVGAGSMSALAAALVADRGGLVTVANRTAAAAEGVAAAVGGSGTGLENLPSLLDHPDLVVSCTGAAGQILDLALVTAAQERRAGRAMVLLDLALPRDVDPAVRHLPGVTLVDLETLAAALAGTEHADEVEATRAIVAEEVAAFLGWQRAVSVAPTVVALRAMADAVVQAELVRLAGRLPDLDAKARAEFEQTVSRVVDKLLHAPTVRVKQLAEEPGGQAYADALTRLFDLDPKAVEAMTAVDLGDEGSAQ
jgi:glutamyl-tRNA reductase